MHTLILTAYNALGWRIKLSICVDLNKIKQNLLDIKRIANTKLLVMLKANAYGFGSVQVAKSMQNIVDMFGVVTLEEALQLKSCGVKKDVLVCACAPCELLDAIHNGFVISLHNQSQLDKLKSLVMLNFVNAKDVRLHIKVDSGMHRLGFDCNQLDDVLASLIQLGVRVEGVFSHLRDVCLLQMRQFDKMSQKVVKMFDDNTVVCHLASSHSYMLDNFKYNMVRIGIGAYADAMSVYSKVLATRFVEKGEFVSYGNFQTQHATNLATIFGGYADGLAGVKRVWIDGVECRVVGNICMDTFVVDCGSFAPQVDSDVLIFDNAHLEHYMCDTSKTEYQIYTSFCGRYDRVYIE